MDLDDVEAGAIGAGSGGTEGLGDGGDSGAVELVGLRVIGGEGDGGGGEDIRPAALVGSLDAVAGPGAIRAGFAAGVGELDSGARALGMKEGGDAGQGRDVLVLPEAEILGADAAFGGDGGGFGEDEGCAADGAAAEVDEMPVVREAVVAGVFAHGGDDDAVGEGEGADGDGGEEARGILGWHV